MGITVTPEQIASVRLLIATPAYGGVNTTAFTRALVNLTKRLTEIKLSFGLISLDNNPWVEYARNSLANIFYFDLPEYTHLLFLDADNAWEVDDILMTLFVKPDSIVALPYAQKQLHWKFIAEAAKQGVAADKLVHFGLVAAFGNDLQQGVNLSEPSPVDSIGMGAMCIPRTVFEKLHRKHPKWQYKLRPREIAETESGRDYAIEFFRTGVDPKTRFWMGEDEWFCRQVTALGETVWTLPWVKTSHIGPYNFPLDLVETAKLTGL